jgi:serine/threonine-protein kinase PpkA
MKKDENTDYLPDIPGYKNIKLIGSGGIALVYSGINRKNGRKAAIKILKPILVKENSISRRFLKEIQTISRLRHPNIISITRVGQTHQVNYLIMEFMPANLAEKIHSLPGRIPVPVCLEITRKIAGALHYAHLKGIIHRDIKSENIMFREDGTPVLVDFGLAKIVDSLEKLTKSGLTVGTPEYMSPELIQGTDIDGRSDIYSLGVVLYEMLTGEVPYKARHYVALAMKHIKKRIPKLPRKKRSLQPVLNKMMAKKRENRFENAGDLIEFLKQFVV